MAWKCAPSCADVRLCALITHTLTILENLNQVKISAPMMNYFDLFFRNANSWNCKPACTASDTIQGLNFAAQTSPPQDGDWLGGACYHATWMQPRPWFQCPRIGNNQG